MKKVISSIRDLKLIEKELIKEHSGAISIQLDDERIYQLASNFVYLDKNIYVFLQVDEDLYQQLRFGYSGSFTIHKFDNKFKEHDLFAESTYRLTSVTVNGVVREVEDKKLVDQIFELYNKKYSSNIALKEYMKEKILKPVMIDTEELLAFNEEGN
ncbi:MAG: pyridoxamine 5'-phosphate oxidase family protein [Ignavibacteriaceae bacterium]